MAREVGYRLHMRWIWVLALVVACGKSKATCKTEVDDLMTYLRAMDHTPPRFFIPDDLHLVARPELPAPDSIEAPAVYARPSGLEYHGEHIAIADVAGLLLSAATKIQSDIDEGKTPRNWVWDRRVYVVIDRDVPWSTVTAIAEAAAATGFTKWIAVFSKPSSVEAPPRSSVSDQIDKILADKSDNKATQLANVLSDVVRSCPSMNTAFGKVVTSETDDKAAVLIAAIEPALLGCTCSLDMAAFRTAFFTVTGNLHPQTTLVVTLDKTAIPIALPASIPWHIAAAKLVAGTAWLQSSER